jgi:hypothetical protein
MYQPVQKLYFLMSLDATSGARCASGVWPSFPELITLAAAFVF